MEANPAIILEDVGSIPELTQWVMSRGVGHRLGSGLALLWLWHSLVAAAPIRPLTWELPYAIGGGPKKQKKKKKKTEAEAETNGLCFY